jgi:hypothetical protein
MTLSLHQGWLEPMLTVLQDPLTNAGLVGNVQRRVSDNGIDHAGIYVDGTGKLVHQQALPQNGVNPCPGICGDGRVLFDTPQVFLMLQVVLTKVLSTGGRTSICVMKVRRLGLDICMAFGSVVRHHVSLSRDRSSLQNERNSRLVQARWRIRVKWEMTQVWVKELQRQAFRHNAESGRRFGAKSFEYAARCRRRLERKRLDARRGALDSLARPP